MLRGELSDVLSDFHRAEMRAAHGAEVRALCPLLWQGLIVKLARGLWIEREIKLVFPSELEACLTDSIIPVLRAGMTFGEVGAVGGNFVGDDSVLHVLFVW